MIHFLKGKTVVGERCHMLLRSREYMLDTVLRGELAEQQSIFIMYVI